MTKYPLVSVIMPVYNAGKYLESSIESILNQTFRNYEFIIINDGSTDNSLDIISHYKSIDNRIKVINQKNKGLIYSLNQAIKISKGDYLARMDSDDISYSSRFQKQLNLMISKDSDVCGCHYYIIDEFNEKIDFVLTPLKDQNLIFYLISSVPVPHGGAMIRKSFLTDNKILYGMNDINHAEDKAFWCEIYEAGGKFTNVDEVLFEYRTYAQSLSYRNKKRISSDVKKIRKIFIQNNKAQINKTIDLILQRKTVTLNNREKEYFLDIALSKNFIKVKNLLPLVFSNPRYSIISIFKKIK